MQSDVRAPRIAILLLLVSLPARGSEPAFRFVLEGPGLVEGQPDEAVRSKVRVLIATEGLSPGEPGAEAWSMGILGSGCAIVGATALGTVSEGADFLDVQITDEGIVAAAILDYNSENKEIPLTLDPGRSPQEVLRLEVQTRIPAAGCSESVLSFVDGLEGQGRPVRNLVTYEGGSRVPAFGRLAFNRCPGTCGFQGPTFLSSGSPVVLEATLTAASPRACFSFLAPPDKALALTLIDPHGGNSNVLFGRCGAEPTPALFDASAEERLRASQRLVVPAGCTSAYHALVQSIVLDEDPSPILLEACLVDLCLESIAPREASVGTRIHASITGSGFIDSVTGFSLVKSDRPDQEIAAGIEDIQVLSGTRAHAVFHLGLDAGLGLYHLKATDGVLEAKLENAFRAVERRLGDQLRIEVIGNARYRYDRLSSLTVRYRNTGDVEVPAPLLKITGPPRTRMHIEGDPDYEGNEILALAANPRGPAGWLPPGAAGEIPLILRTRDCDHAGAEGCDDPTSQCPIEFQARLFTPTREDLVGWESLAVPEGMDAGEWPEVREDLARLLGDSWRECIEGLGEVAEDLARRGIERRSARNLFRAAVQEASGRSGAEIGGTLLEAGSLRPLAGERVVALKDTRIASCARTDAGGNFVLQCLANATTYQILVEGKNLEYFGVTIPDQGDLLGLVIHVPPGPGDFSAGDLCPACGEEGLPLSPLVPPAALFTLVASRRAEIVFPCDPNVKDSDEEDDAPTGKKNLVGIGKEILYTIYFENQPSAGTPVQRVTVVDHLDPNLDWSSVRLLDMRWSMYPVSHPALGEGYSAPLVSTAVSHRWPEGPGGQDWTLQVDTFADFDIGTGTITWQFETLDENGTPESPDAGFLLPNVRCSPEDPGDDRCYRGEACVSFLAKPRSNLPDGATIRNQASIRFDGRDPQLTNEVIREVILRPDTPRNPVPADGFERPVDTDVRFGWDHSTRTDLWDVYIWKKEGDFDCVAADRPSLPTVTDLPVNGCRPPFAIDEDCDYCWQVVARSLRTPETAEGPVWRFTTRTDAGAPIFKRGDADGSGKIDLTDAIFILQFLFMGGGAPACMDAADADDSGKLDLTDPIYLLQFLFMGGPPPPDPGPTTCGPDPTPDEYVECLYTNC